MVDKLPHSSSELDRYIAASGENDHIDAKGPLAWDGGIASARLAKHFAAFANSRDGGVIVIGKKEGDTGIFELTGMTDDQAKSFETTAVSKWVNGYFSPPIALICHHHEYEGKRFVIITINEFSEVPSLCIKSFQDPNNPNRHILRERTIYIRNSHAESEPLASPGDLRTLIGIATTKRRDELVQMFDSIVNARPLLRITDEDQFNEELKVIETGLGDTTYSAQLHAGAWRLVFRPSKYDSDRWSGSTDLETVVDRRSLNLYASFPPTRTGTHRREWGIANDAYGEIWTLAKSGQFVYVEEYRENAYPYKSSWIPPAPEIPAGRWLEFTVALRHIFEMAAFAARLSEEFSAGEQVEFLIQATGLQGRRLVSTSLSISWEASDECRAQLFECKRSASVDEFRATWKSIAADAMSELVRSFPHPYGHKLSNSTAREWVDKFESRDF